MKQLLITLGFVCIPAATCVGFITQKAEGQITTKSFTREYIIESKSDFNSLTRSVSGRLNEGFQLHGDLVVSVGNGGERLFFQALVR
jgi:hypothetical protein